MLPIAGKIILLVFIVATACAFFLRVKYLVSLLRLGKAENRFDKPLSRLMYVLGQVLLQRCVLKNVTAKDRSGLGHMMIFYGFCLFVISYTFHITEGFYDKLSPALFGGIFNNLFFLFLDVAGLVVILALIWAALRRYLSRPSRLEPIMSKGAAIVLVWIFLLMILGFSVEGFRLLTEERPFAEWAFMGSAFSGLFSSMGLESQARPLFYVFWFIHMAFIFAFGIYILYSKHLHILASHFNLFFHNRGPKGALQPITDMENADSFGASNVTEFTWKQLLDLYACTECGHCNVNCPATLSEKPLHPKDVIANLKKHLLADGKDFLVGIDEANKDDYCVIGASIVPEDNIWDCTNCGACMEACPVGIEHVQKIADMRRYLVLMESKFPSEVRSVFKGMENNSNPWGIGKSTRGEWAEGLDIKVLSKHGGGVDILYYVGCAASFDDHGKKVARAMVKILNAAGIDFGILGHEECCCGDPARRIGNEYLYQMMVEENINVLNKYRFKRIVTACPHGFNTLKNEYPKMGGHYEVLHHSELIMELFQQGKLQIQGEMAKTITYHDSCFLGRYNANYELPRKIIDSIPKTNLVEMDRNRKFAFCCGAGGGRMWLPRVRGQRVYAMRTEQALAKNPDVIATACPFCTIHFEDGLKFHDADSRVKVVDIAELVANHLAV